MVKGAWTPTIAACDYIYNCITLQYLLFKALGFSVQVISSHKPHEVSSHVLHFFRFCILFTALHFIVLSAVFLFLSLSFVGQVTARVVRQLRQTDMQPIYRLPAAHSGEGSGLSRIHPLLG